MALVVFREVFKRALACLWSSVSCYYGPLRGLVIERERQRFGVEVGLGFAAIDRLVLDGQKICQEIRLDAPNWKPPRSRVRRRFEITEGATGPLSRPSM